MVIFFSCRGNDLNLICFMFKHQIAIVLLIDYTDNTAHQDSESAGLPCEKLDRHPRYMKYGGRIPINGAFAVGGGIFLSTCTSLFLSRTKLALG